MIQWAETEIGISDNPTPDVMESNSLTEKLNDEKTSQSLKSSNKRPSESREKHFLLTVELPSKITMNRF